MGKGKGVLWFLYACALGFGFSRTTASLARMMGLSVSAYFLLTAAPIIAVLLFFYLPGKLLAGKFGSGTKKNVGQRIPAAHRRQPHGMAHRVGLCGWLSGALLLGALICVRLFFAPSAGSVELQPAFERAVAASKDGGLCLFLSELYVRILSVLISVLGGSRPVFTGNLIFQASGSLFLYFGVYMLAGGICACTALLCVICLPVFHNSAYMAEPQSLLFLFCGALVWICALCLSAAEKKAGRKRLSALPGAAAGLACGAACGIHLLLGCFLFLFPAGALRCRKKAGTVRLFIAFFLSAAAGFFLIIYLSGPENGQGAAAALQRWLSDGISREYDAVLHSPSLTDWWKTVPAYLLAFLAVFGVLEKEGTDASIWILPFLAVIAAETITEAPLQEQGMRFVLLGVMAGCGIGQTICAPAVRRAERGSEREAVRTFGGGVQMELEFLEESGCGPEKGRVEQVAEQSGRTAGTVPEKQEAQFKMQSPAPGTWLDNPLPVPKRHVKKEMGYGFEPEPDQMFYDIPVSDLDDFDIE